MGIHRIFRGGQSGLGLFGGVGREIEHAQNAHPKGVRVRTKHLLASRAWVMSGGRAGSGDPVRNPHGCAGFISSIRSRLNASRSRTDGRIPSTEWVRCVRWHRSFLPYAGPRRAATTIGRGRYTTDGSRAGCWSVPSGTLGREQPGRPQSLRAHTQTDTLERCIYPLEQRRGLATRTDKLAISSGPDADQRDRINELVHGGRETSKASTWLRVQSAVPRPDPRCAGETAVRRRPGRCDSGTRGGRGGGSGHPALITGVGEVLLRGPVGQELDQP